MITQLTSGVRSPTQMLVSTSPGARRVLLWFSLNLGAEKVAMKINQCCRTEFGSRTCSDRILRIQQSWKRIPNLTESIPPLPFYCDSITKNMFKVETSNMVHCSFFENEQKFYCFQIALTVSSLQ
jgi:hypothetical protein